MSFYIVQEVDGTSRFTLENSSGFLLLETATEEVDPPFISSVTVVYDVSLAGSVLLSQESVEVVVSSNSGNIRVSQESVEVLHQNSSATTSGGLSQMAVEVLYKKNFINLPFISSNTVVYPIFSMFDPNFTSFGPGNGGETFMVRLAPNGTSVSGALVTGITATGTQMNLTGYSGMPTANPFVVTVDSEQIYVSPSGSPGWFTIITRATGNTTAAAHSAGATVTWDDSYDMPVVAADILDASFTADIQSSGSFTYYGWLISYDSSQAYNSSGSRYPMHVTSFEGVFPAGTGTTGTNRMDAAQPNAICTPVGVSDDCPAALSNPSRISSNISVGDVAVVRYTNPAAFVLDLGPRSAALQSWYGLARVDSTNNDVTLTNVNGYVVDSIPPATYTGSVNGEFHNPSATAISPTTGTPSPNPEPYTTVNLPGADRFFTYGSPHYSDRGWPICCLTVRQGNRRVPFWQSYDWHNFDFVYCGFGTDCTYAQVVINRNGVVTGAETTYALPNSNDLTGPNAVWDDGTYYFGASWYVVIFLTPFLVLGPSIGGTVPLDARTLSYNPIVSFTGGGGTTITDPNPPPVEGGSGGGITPPANLHIWHRPWKTS